MKRVALFAIVALFAACAPKEEAPATEAAADSMPVAAPAPAADTTMAKPDSAAVDTTKKM